MWMEKGTVTERISVRGNTWMKITEVMTQQSDTGYRKESNRYFKNKGHKEEVVVPERFISKLEIKLQIR